MTGEPRANILIIDDDPGAAAGLRRVLEVEGYAVEAVETADEGIARAQTSNFDIVLSDLDMPGKSGLEVISELHALKPCLPIILVTGKHTDDAAIEAIRRGAYDYILKNPQLSQPKPVDFQEKPVNAKDFLDRIQKALLSRAASQQQALEPRRNTGLASTGEPPAGESIVGRSQAMQRVFKFIGRVATKPLTVLIRGETGTGKELVARAIYQHSQRAQQPFVIVNCASIPDTLLESELFGHEAGAFTGAQDRRLGKFEQADKGTIFLDEVGDMNLATQAKLLRVLEEKTIQRIGSQQPINVDVRVLAATHRELETAVQEKKFRADLYYRLNDAVIHLPSLRERREDIPDLVHYFLSRQPEQPGTPKPTITPEAVRLLQYRAWPGNVQELRNVVHKASLLAHGYPIDPQIIRQAVEQPTRPSPDLLAYLQVYVAELLERAEAGPTANAQAALTEWVERELYGQAIRLAEGDLRKVATWLGVSRAVVRKRLRYFDLYTPQAKAVKDEGPVSDETAAPNDQSASIPGYESVCKIGRGAYGQVWLVRGVAGGYKAAKIIRRTDLPDTDAFEQEFCALSIIESRLQTLDGLVRILHIGRNDRQGYYYYVMELADAQSPQWSQHPETYVARTLGSEIRQRGMLPIRECLEIGISLATTLENLHAQGLVHRDIKPPNIIFVKGSPKLADIGLVTDVGRRTHVGTKGYMPPEGPGKPPADIYSLGKVIYEMATGLDRLGFPKPPSDAPEIMLRFLEILKKACAEDPGQRYQFSKELCQALVDFQANLRP